MDHQRKAGCMRGGARLELRLRREPMDTPGVDKGEFSKLSWVHKGHARAPAGGTRCLRHQ